MALTVGSLFSGIGGIDLGLERAGMKIMWQIEVDPFLRRILGKHWPNVNRYGDIRELDINELERVDLICGGFPCQPVSLAGRRKGKDGPRWLWPEFERAIRILRPRFVLVENVPGLLTRGMDEVLRSLAALGYDAEWTVLSAAAFGAPHLRERLWVVAYSFGQGLEVGQVFGGDAAKELAAFVRDSRSHWATEPDVGRMAYGIPHRVDRIKALGNAVVPQIAEWIGRRILGSFFF